MSKRAIDPRTYFLNERHESRDEKSGGGRLPNFGTIDWRAKGQGISHSLRAVAKSLESSDDPLAKKHYYLVARPVDAVPKLTTKKNETSEVNQKPDYTRGDSRVFGRLGLDLLNVTADGNAIVHATPERIEQLATRTASLESIGVREQARWSTIGSFEVIPPRLRIDDAWLATIEPKAIVEAIIQLQPLLNVVEIDAVMRAIARITAEREKERIITNGSDLTGRQWMRARVSRATLERLAKDFYSIEIMHEPLKSVVAAQHGSRNAPSRLLTTVAVPPPVDSLPTVAVFDVGIPPGHQILAKYRRGEFVSQPDLSANRGSHGSLVASRVVFGERDLSDGSIVDPQSGTCRFLDVKCSDGINDIDDKAIITSLKSVVGAYADTRVFNFSFASKTPLDLYGEAHREAQLLLTEQLDNFIFEYDVLIAVAAGNSPPGRKPVNPYPMHIDEPEWKLGRWALGFNTMVCGSHIGAVGANGLIRRMGLPSPFSRIGLGISDAPTPSFTATGGDVGENYMTTENGNTIGGLGVWCCNEIGQWEDHSGTSYSVPLLAREAALALHHLQTTQPGVRPFAVTVRAFLALTATLPYSLEDVTGPELKLCKRTLGLGVASSEKLTNPDSNNAIVIWQGILNDSSDLASIELPILREWLKLATKPRMRAAIAYDPPVNHAVPAVWACRKIQAVLLPCPGGTGIRAKGTSHRSYTLVTRDYDLQTVDVSQLPAPENWRFEINYSEQDMAEYPPTATFSPLQRVAVAIELFDDCELPLSPQPFIQALPNFVTMNRLSLPPVLTVAPVILRSRT